MEYWGGATVAERPVQRDRAAEFSATGDVAQLLWRTEQARRRLRDDIAGFDASAPPASVRPDPDDSVPYARAKGSVLLHILEELFQHLGQMEITRDALRGRPAAMTTDDTMTTDETMTTDDTPIPIACSLDAGSLAERAGEWQSFVTSSVVARRGRRYLGAHGAGGLAVGTGHRRVPRSTREAVLPLLRCLH